MSDFRQSTSAAFGAGRKEVTGVELVRRGTFGRFDSGRKLRPIEQWCVSSPRQSMVPLNGGENSGEVAPGVFRGERLSRLEECITEVQRPSGVGQK